MTRQFITILALCAALSLSAADAPYPCKVGDKVEGWNVADWYKATVEEVGSGNYNGYCLLKWDDYKIHTWINAENIRTRKNVSKTSDASPSSAPPATKYVCGVFLNLNGQFTYTQAVVLKKDGTYQPSVGAAGRYRYDAAIKRIDFEGGALKELFGRYEPDNKQIFRLTLKEDAAKSSQAQNWRSQVCSPKNRREPATLAVHHGWGAVVFSNQRGSAL